MAKKVKAWDRLTIARMIERPTTLDYIERIFTNFLNYMAIDILEMINLL